MKKTTSMAIIQVSVVRALRHSGRRKTGTALETASTPVIETAPEEKARNTSSRPTPSAAAPAAVAAG